MLDFLLFFSGILMAEMLSPGFEFYEELLHVFLIVLIAVTVFGKDYKILGSPYLYNFFSGFSSTISSMFLVQSFKCLKQILKRRRRMEIARKIRLLRDIRERLR